MLHIMSAVAEQEAKAISERTIAALAVAKARGAKLGWSIPSRRQEQARAARKGVAVRIAHANAHAANVLPIIAKLQKDGASLRQIAAALNERSVKTARGGQWQATTVSNIIARADKPRAAE